MLILRFRSLTGLVRFSVKRDVLLELNDEDLAKK